MRTFTLLLCGAFALVASAADPKLAGETRAALAKSAGFYRSISTHGGYLWRYSVDMKKRWGESEATATQVWVQPPGTPAVGMAFLRAHEVTGEKQYLDAARDAAMALVFGQLESGGWDYRIDFDPQGAQRFLRREEAARLSEQQRARRRNNTVFDDDNTQSAIRFLLVFVKAAEKSPDAKDVQIRDALEYALRGVLKAQYPNGAWPQVYMGAARNEADYPILKAKLVPNHRELPKVKEYWHFYTFNDQAMNRTMATLLAAHEQLKRPEYLDAVKKCGEFMLLAQLPEPQPVWAQQYDFQMRPAWARRFEPASVCSGESTGVMRSLMELYLVTGDRKYLEPIPRAIAWFKRSSIGPNKWARFYEMGTNRPLYFTKEYELTYSDADLPTHYSFQSDYGVASTIAQHEEIVKLGREAYLKARESRRDSAPSEARVRQAIGALDGQGRWVSEGQIESRTFIRNVEILCDYLAGEGQI